LFYNGVDVVNPSTFLKPGTTYTVYIAEYSQKRLDQVIASLQQDSVQYKINMEEAYTSPSENEAIFNLSLSQVIKISK
jgi:flagellar biosynthesis/type III secretory pathway M-ring protein FliF/YscJ